MSHNNRALAEVETEIVEEVIYETIVPLSRRNGQPTFYSLTGNPMWENSRDVLLKLAEAGPDNDIKITITRIK
jgi:hypothetical protein